MFLEAPARLATRGALRRSTAGAGLADDVKRPEIDSPEALEAWLADKPTEWAQVIAVRAALRVFPLVFRLLEVPEELVTHHQKRNFTLWTFRVGFSVRFACKFPSLRASESAAAAILADRRHLGAILYETVVDDIVVAAIDAVEAVAGSLSDAFDAVTTVNQTAVYAAASTAVSAVRSTDDETSAAMLWQAVSEDCRWLLEGKVRADLVDQPLWLSDVRGKASYRANFPPWIREPFGRFAARDEVKNGPWGLIVDWYRAILPEPGNARPRSLFGETADIAIATQPDNFWTVTEDRSAEDILSEIAEIANYRLPEQERSEGDTSPDLIVSLLEKVGRPVSLDEIRGYFMTFETQPTKRAVRVRLSELVQSGRIIRTAPSIYVHPNWATDTTPDWDFFLSYSQHDLAAARRISDVLEDEGYAVFSQFNDMTAGKSFVGEMNRGLAGMGRMIAAYSPDYFSSGPCQSEWEAAYTTDAWGKQGKIVPFMVRPCEPPPLARRLVWTSLLGLSPEQEREAVLRAIRGGPTPRDRVAQRAAMKAAASPDVGLDPSGQKLDALPNKEFDQPFVDEDLFELPERLRGLIGTILDVLEGRNAPRGVATALRSYVAELEARGASCSLGVLRDQMAFVEAEVDDPEAEYWCSGAGLKTSIANLRRLHALLLTHYPLDQERERLLRAVEIDEEKFSPDESRKLRDEIKEAVKEALADDSVTESYRDAVENRARVVRDTLDLRTPDVPTDGDPEYIQREQDRHNRVKDAKKRALAQEAALADKTLDVIGKMAKVADSPAVQKLARSMRDLAEWFWSS